MDAPFTKKRLKGKYLLVDKLGRGGMGIVFKALLMPIENEVALKVFYPPTGMFKPEQEQELRTRFIIEGHVMAKMRHKNIMALHDFDIDDDIPFYTMDILSKSLEKLIGEDINYHNTTPLPEEEVIRICTQICDGLSYLHSKGVVHRDLKPGNILITEENEIKISDFGISDIGWLDYTDHGGGFMSANYCSPEQRKGENVDHRSDIYTLGMIIFRLLTGLFPSLDHSSVSELNDEIDPIWDELVKKALKENPKDRYQNALDLKEAILELGDEEHLRNKNLVKIPAGDFLFGKEMETKFLEDFWIDKYPVTNKEYRRFIESQKYPEPLFWKNPKFNQDNQPVVGISWEDADAYAKWMQKRLPTEEEWEKAARGTKGNPYPWGKELPSRDYCNYGEKVKKTSIVTKYKKNKSVFGCRDCVGNVWEWTGTSDEEDESLKVIKGGSWLSFKLQLKCSNKDHLHFEEKKDYVGFRCVRDEMEDKKDPYRNLFTE